MPAAIASDRGRRRGSPMAVAPISDDSAQNAPRLALAAGAAVLRADAARVALARLDAALLAVLALEGPTSRQRLLHLLWPDEEPENARNALRQRLFRLRRAVGAELVAGGELLSLARGVEHDVDADADGLLLGAHDYADCPAFDQWLDAQRGMIAARRRERDSARLDACERDGRYAEGAALAERLVAADALDEAAVQRLMKLRYLDGQRAAAVAAFERFATALLGDQGGLPSRATTELLATIRSAREPVPVRCAFPASVLRPPRLIGRDGERRRLHAAWSAESVFWLLGEAGLGKTRLIGEFVAEAFEAPCRDARRSGAARRRRRAVREPRPRAARADRTPPAAARRRRARRAGARAAGDRPRGRRASGPRAAADAATRDRVAAARRASRRAGRAGHRRPALRRLGEPRDAARAGARRRPRRAALGLRAAAGRRCGGGRGAARRARRGAARRGARARRRSTRRRWPS